MANEKYKIIKEEKYNGKKKVKKKKKIVTTILFLFLFLFFISSVYAWDIERTLVQTQVDEDYPCSVSGVQIICQALNTTQRQNWLNRINNGTWALANPASEYSIDEVNQSVINNRTYVTQAGSFLENATIVGSTYTFSPDIYSQQSTYWKIGFGTNTFTLSGAPLENFDVSFTRGELKYRPINLTWLSFDGSNDEVDFSGISITYGSNWSMGAWFNYSTTDVGEGDLIIGGSSTGTGRKLLITDGILRGTNRNSTSSSEFNVTSSFLVNNSLWQHAFLVHNGSTIFLYLNGTLINQTDIIGSISGSGTTTSVGESGSGSNDFTGWIDEPRLYGSVLSASDVLKIYDSGRRLNSSLDFPNPIVWSGFNENNGTFIFNRINATNNGTISGATWKNDGKNVTTLGYQVNISVINQTRALIFWNNYTLINNSRTGNNIYSFVTNQTIFIIDNFEVTENALLTNSPINFSNASLVYKNIVNLLKSQITTNVTVLATCNNLESVIYTIGGSPTTYEPDEDFTCSNNRFTLNLNIGAQGTTNEMTLEYDCGDTFAQIGNRLIMIFASIIIFLFMGIYLYKNGILSMNLAVFLEISIAIIVGIILWQISGQNLGTGFGGSCPVNT